MQIAIDKIQARPGRRSAPKEKVEKLAESMEQVGLLNPITVDKNNVLIAGLHRLEAAKLLGWAEIECTVSILEGLEAELAEIDENIVRSDLSPVEFGELLLRRKEVYEAMHPETKNGGDKKSHEIRTRKARSDFSKSFVADTAQKLGISRRTVEERIQTAKNLTPEAKEIIKGMGTSIPKKATLKLSRLGPAQQKEAASLLASGAIKTVDEYLADQQGTPAMPDEAGEAADSEGTEPLSIRGSAAFRDIVADLKDTTKDCSCTPDSFLAEMTAFVQKFRTEFDWYCTPYYEAVYPALTQAQLDYLQQQTDLICDAVKYFLRHVKGC